MTDLLSIGEAMIAGGFVLLAVVALVRAPRAGPSGWWAAAFRSLALREDGAFDYLTKPWSWTGSSKPSTPPSAPPPTPILLHEPWPTRAPSRRR